MHIFVKIGKICITSLLQAYHCHCEYRENLYSLLHANRGEGRGDNLYYFCESLSYMPIIVKVGRIYTIVGKIY